jgi:hypothetical protein
MNWSLEANFCPVDVYIPFQFLVEDDAMLVLKSMHFTIVLVAGDIARWVHFSYCNEARSKYFSRCSLHVDTTQSMPRSVRVERLGICVGCRYQRMIVSASHPMANLWGDASWRARTSAREARSAGTKAPANAELTDGLIASRPIPLQLPQTPWT